MGFFSKLFSALKKTKDGLSEKLRGLFSRDKIGEEFYEELEDILISSDISSRISVTVCEKILGFGGDVNTREIKQAVGLMSNP